MDDRLGHEEIHDIDWHEANYKALLRSGADEIQRLDALSALLEEQYVEQYMTEFAALCLRNGREKEARRILKRRSFLFPGGAYEELAQQLNDAANVDTVLAALDSQAVSESSQNILPEPVLASAEGKPEDSALPVPIMRCFERVVGMEAAKTVLTDFYTSVQYQTARAGYNLKSRRHYHFILEGGTGVGKTLLAQRICALLCDMGLSGEAEPYVLEGYRLPELLGTNGDGMEDILRQCENRTVVVDGIVSLFTDNSGQTGLPLLFRTVLERNSEKANLILIGTKSDIDHLLTIEPTLAGWFLYHIDLPPYSPEQLTEMAVIIAKEQGYTLSTAAKEVLRDQLENEHRSPIFQAGKTIEGIIGRASVRLARRTSAMATTSKGKLMRIEPGDLDDVRETLQLDELMAQLDSLVGLTSVKEEVRKLTALVRVGREAQRMGQPASGFGTLHMVFSGNPGTGKTTVARIIGGIYRALGILPQGDKLVECLRSDLVAEFVGQTAPKVKAKIAEAMGGVLFIDEAYDLCRDDSDSYGMEAVNTLVAEIENHRNDMMVIIAGYTEDMGKFLTRNQGLASRFPNHIEFPDYSQAEMEEIFQGMLASSGKRLEHGCEELMRAYIEENRVKRDFGNARGIRNLRDKLIASQAVRLGAKLEEKEILAPEDLELITSQDFDGLVDKAEEKKTYEDWLEELNNLTGLSSVKERVRQLAALARTNAEAKRLGLPATGFGTLHMVFAGNPGTGKTTVARIIGGIYRALGILPDGDRVVECTRADLVASYVGQTAPKVKEKIKEALGGVLFIDEAYDLCGDNDSYGMEAVNTLVSEIENHRSDLMVIIAGYTGEMDKFLNRNQGLVSRFPNRIEFPDYSEGEMEDIFRRMLASSERRLDEGCDGLLKAYIGENRSKKDFGNARGIRNLCDKLIAAQSTRLNCRIEHGETLTASDFLLVTAQDFERLIDHHGGKKSVDDWLAELDTLTGLAGVKEQVRRKVNTMLGRQKMKDAGIMESFDPGTLHMVFKGNAGTGKTTVARIIAGIYNSLGLLPDGDIFVECSRSDLVAEYVGQTAAKVKSVVRQAIGGVLFIDEAYSLCRDANDTFGREAIDALIADMENHRRELMVILAGYTEDMDRFFSFNQGMASRVPTSLIFEDYSKDELFQIFQNMLRSKNFTLSEDAMAPVRELIDRESKSAGFGNARGVRNIAERIIERHIAAIGERAARGEMLDKAAYLTILPEEIPAVKSAVSPKNKAFLNDLTL